MPVSTLLEALERDWIAPALEQWRAAQWRSATLLAGARAVTLARGPWRSPVARFGRPRPWWESLAAVLTVMRREVPAGAEALGADLHPVLRRVYAARGLRTREELNLALERLAPIGSLGGAEAAARLLLRHRRGRVLVVGDFDADGATSTALMLRALRGFGFAAVDFLVPNRFEYGYGLTPEIVAVAAERAPTLIVTVDNGISSHAGVAAARARGIEVLITDHHLPGPRAARRQRDRQSQRCRAMALPAARSPASAWPSTCARPCAVRSRRAGDLPAGAPAVASFLDLVALGTVADVVPLDANNRVLVAQGLARIRAGRCVPGISALLERGARARRPNW